MRKGKVSRKHRMGAYLGRVWLFDVQFAPHETVSVRHTYFVPGGGSVDGTKMTLYVTRTGALWAGPIGVARFHFRIPVDTHWVDEPKNLKRSGRQLVSVDKDPYIELSYEARDWTPDGDVWFEYRAGTLYWTLEQQDDDPAHDGPKHSGLPETERCQSFLSVLAKAEEIANPYPQSKTPTEADVQADLSKGINTRRICKNAVFALHGRRFQDDRLNRYFYGPKGFVAGEWPYEVMRPNPGFDTALLSKGQWKAIELFERFLPEDKGAADAKAARPAATKSATPKDAGP